MKIYRHVKNRFVLNYDLDAIVVEYTMIIKRYHDNKCHSATLLQRVIGTQYVDLSEPGTPPTIYSSKVFASSHPFEQS